MRWRYLNIYIVNTFIEKKYRYRLHYKDAVSHFWEDGGGHLLHLWTVHASSLLRLLEYVWISAPDAPTPSRCLSPSAVRNTGGPQGWRRLWRRWRCFTSTPPRFWLVCFMNATFFIVGQLTYMGVPQVLNAGPLNGLTLWPPGAQGHDALPQHILDCESTVSFTVVLFLNIGLHQRQPRGIMLRPKQAVRPNCRNVKSSKVSQK